MPEMRPLSAHALAELRDIAASPVPAVSVNAGVVARLLREGLVIIMQLRSPFRTHKGKLIAHLEITDAGRQRLKAGGDA